MTYDQVEAVVGTAREILLERLGQKNLAALGIAETPDVVIDRHLEHDATVRNRNHLYRRILFHGQNRQYMSNAILSGLQGKDFDAGIAAITHGFDPDAVIGNWKTPVEYHAYLKENGIPNVGNQSWKNFSRLAISAACFIRRFDTHQEFLDWLLADTTPAGTLETIHRLKGQIDGYGFALICDFLKDMGFRNIVKPDRHIVNIGRRLGITNHGEGEPEAVLADYMSLVPHLTRLGTDLNSLDKYLWLIGSGKFYLYEAPQLKIPRSADIFMERIMTHNAFR